MIVDSSALVAIAYAEPEAAQLLGVLRTADRRRIAAPTVLESSMVLWRVAHRVADLVGQLDLEIVAFDADHLRVAQDAFIRYGRGTGSPARLNFGDCISYALASATGEPLLFKGEDLRHTDITPAWTPPGR
ncbi:type II toxin-antitoxin system VapC family toxin [Nocardioides rotundus]|uniref:type II toxin-antitoxin system VapC family toxin n=1 Tax=Nocardioides rotundus TaxID=1774216 RepID=UPI001CBBA6B4|nr:type II toxin-antitoxin system VapC family toxin [Nocardioides rotundus]UAL29447.1 type II toxin-antitoxin system VapC family toxin [Nocardioides rotundus]